MLLTELNIDEELLIKSYYYDTSKYGNAEETFSTSVKEIYEKGIVTDEMRAEGGSPINFESNIVCSDMYLIRKGENPIIWKDVFIKRVFSGGKSSHVVIVKSGGEKFNRRYRYRVHIGSEGIARLGLNRTTASVLVKDISMSGFCIIADTKYDLKINDSVRVTFDDFNEHLIVEGVCIRKKVLDELRVSYGCVISVKPKELKDYIRNKQMAIVKRKKDKE